jgi:hypothetical protein
MRNDLNESNKLSFRPDLSLTLSRSSRNDSFMQRQAKYHKSKSKKKDSLRQSLDSSDHSECTFSPKINRSKAQSKVKLYLQGKLTKENKNVSLNKSAEKSRAVNYEKIEFLYKEYKIFKANKKELQKTVDKEAGFTYKPKISKYSINSSFEERHNKFIENKKKLLEESTQERKRSSEKINTSALIERLYDNSVEKVRERNSIDDKKYDFKSTLRSDESDSPSKLRSFTKTLNLQKVNESNIYNTLFILNDKSVNDIKRLGTDNNAKSTVSNLDSRSKISNIP